MNNKIGNNNKNNTIKTRCRNPESLWKSRHAVLESLSFFNEKTTATPRNEWNLRKSHFTTRPLRCSRCEHAKDLGELFFQISMPVAIRTFINNSWSHENTRELPHANETPLPPTSLPFNAPRVAKSRGFKSTTWKCRQIWKSVKCCLIG